MSQIETPQAPDNPGNLTIRVTFDAPSPQPLESEQASKAGFHWGRIATALALLAAIVIALVWVFLPQQSAPPVVVAEQDAALAPNAPELKPELAPEPETVVGGAAPSPEPAVSVPPAADEVPAYAMPSPVTVDEEGEESRGASIAPEPGSGGVSVTIHDTAVQRFVLAQSIRRREPVGDISEWLEAGPDAGAVRIHAFSEVHGMAGRTLEYRWIHEGRQLATVPVGVGSDRWRSHANKLVTPAMAGHWRVELRDKRGGLLATARFTY